MIKCIYDVVIFGVIGFIGCFVVEYFVAEYGFVVCWVMVGCLLDKLVLVCDEIGVLVDMFLIVVDSFDFVLLVVMVE